jgi:hypothetical protein
MPYTIGVMRVRTTIIYSTHKYEGKKETESSSECLKTEKNDNLKKWEQK